MKTILTVILILVMILTVGFVPNIMLSTTQSIDVLVPSYKELPKAIITMGYMQNDYTQEIYTPSDIIIQEIATPTGYWVSKNTVIATGKDISAVRDVLPSEYLAVISNMSQEEASEIATQYSVEMENQRQSMIDSCPDIDIHAPISGIISWDDVSSETMLLDDSVLGKVTNTNEAYVQVKLDATFSPLLEVGASVALQDSEQTTYLGRVSEITTNEGELDIAIKLVGNTHAPEHLTAFTCELKTVTQEPVVSIPYGIIKQDESNREYVDVYEDGIVEKQYIITGKEFAQSVVVLDGISENDMLIVDEISTEYSNYIISTKTYYEGDAYVA